jgi:hypothetical protein
MLSAALLSPPAPPAAVQRTAIHDLSIVEQARPMLRPCRTGRYPALHLPLKFGFRLARELDGFVDQVTTFPAVLVREAAESKNCPHNPTAPVEYRAIYPEMPILDCRRIGGMGAMRILPMQGKWYVCELGLSAIGNRSLAGPFDTEAEAHAAAGAIEVEHRGYQARTEVWQCPEPAFVALHSTPS